MESYSTETRRESISSNKTREFSQEICSNTLEAMMEELNKTKEEIKKAKENSIHSWLNFRPLIEELNKLKIDLESAKNCSNTSNNVIFELESQLNSLNITIEEKEEEALDVNTLISELTRTTNQTREEIEEVKIGMNEKRRERSKLKQVVKLRRQRLRTLKLRLRAVRLESEAFEASAGEAIRYINCSDDPTVQLDQDEYCALASKAKEETSLAEWRVSVAMEQRPVAEESRDSALRRLRAVYSLNRTTKKEREEKMSGNIRDNGKIEEEHLRIRRFVSPKSRGELKGSKGNNNKRIIKKRQPTGLFQMTAFFCR